MWDKNLNEGQSDDWRQSTEGKLEVGKLTSCKANIKPLLKLLKKEKLNMEILDSLYLIVQYSLMKQYTKANDKYMALSIGNSPWPIGVTMVGIHERSGRSKIFTSQV